MQQEQAKRRGRPPLPSPDMHSISAPWSVKPDFAKMVEEAAQRDGAASASEWVREKLLPHLVRT